MSVRWKFPTHESLSRKGLSSWRVRTLFAGTSQYTKKALSFQFPLNLPYKESHQIKKILRNKYTSYSHPPWWQDISPFRIFLKDTTKSGSVATTRQNVRPSVVLCNYISSGKNVIRFERLYISEKQQLDTPVGTRAKAKLL
jgi:hypothetical protein